MNKDTRKTVKRIAAVGMAVAMAFTVSPIVKSDAATKKPTISKKKLSLEVGKTAKLKVKANKVKIKSTKWSTSAKKVAKVSKKGVVTALKAGSATIKAVVTAKNKKKYTLKCKVTVSESLVENEWITAKDPTVQSGLKKLFDEVNKLDGAPAYTPVATLAYIFTDEGTTWRVLTKESSPIPNTSTFYSIVEIQEKMDGEVGITKEFQTMIDAYPAASEGVSGGFAECDPKFDAAELAAIENNMDKITAAFPGYAFNPIAKVATQVVAGMNYCIICERKSLTNDTATKYSFIYVNVGLDKTVTLDNEKTVHLYMGDDEDASRGGIHIILRDGLTIKDAWISYMGESNGKKWYNFGAVFANSTAEDIELDLSKFSFKTANATGGLTWKTWNIKKNSTYVQWATTAISEDFLSKINIGDEVTISYDGNEVIKTKIEDHSINRSDSSVSSNAWEAPDSPVVDEALKAIVTKATTKESKDVTYTPVAWIGKKESEAGQDYKVFCRKTKAMPGAKTTYSVLDIRANLIGDASVTEAMDTDIDGYGTDPTLGWAEAETPVIAKGEGEILNKALEGYVGVEYKALALLGTEKIRGTKYSFICEGTVPGPNNVPSYYLVQVSVNEEGVAKLGDIKDLANS